MGIRGTLAASALLAVVAVIFWLDTPSSIAPGSDRSPTRPDSTPPGPRLVEVRASDITGISLTLRGETRVVARTGATWTGSDHPSLIDDLVRDLTSLRTLSEIGSPAEELRSFGLAPPQGVVDVQLSDHGAVPPLFVGNRNPPSTAVYVQIGRDGKVFLAGALIDWEIEKAFQTMAPAS